MPLPLTLFPLLLPFLCLELCLIHFLERFMRKLEVANRLLLLVLLDEFPETTTRQILRSKCAAIILLPHFIYCKSPN